MTDVTRSDIKRIVTELIRSPVLQNIYAHDFDARKHKKAFDGDYDSERDSDNFEKFFLSPHDLDQIKHEICKKHNASLPCFL